MTLASNFNTLSIKVVLECISPNAGRINVKSDVEMVLTLKVKNHDMDISLALVGLMHELIRYVALLQEQYFTLSFFD